MAAKNAPSLAPQDEILGYCGHAVKECLLDYWGDDKDARDTTNASGFWSASPEPSLPSRDQTMKEHLGCCDRCRSEGAMCWTSQATRASNVGGELSKKNPTLEGFVQL